MGGRVQLVKNEREKTIEPLRPPISYDLFCMFVEIYASKSLRSGYLK
jgi:hypothetical protein